MNRKDGFKPIPASSTNPGQDVGGSGNGQIEPIKGNWSTPGSRPDGGDYHPIPGNWSTPGSYADSRETYHDGENRNGPTSRSGGSGQINPLPGSSTSPGQSPDGGDYHEVGFGQKQGFGGAGEHVVDTTQGLRDTGYKVLGSVDVTENRENPGCDPAGQGNRSYEQASYFDPGPNEDDTPWYFESNREDDD